MYAREYTLINISLLMADGMAQKCEVASSLPLPFYLFDDKAMWQMRGNGSKKVCLSRFFLPSHERET